MPGVRSFWPVYFINCRFCDVLVAVRSSRRSHCYGPDCRRAYDRERQRLCDARYRAEHDGKSWLQVNYVEQRKAKNRADGFTESKRAAYQRRRALKRGAQAEAFRSEEIYERDGWTCGICAESVDCSLGYPDPMSASLDHVIPLSAGGEHTRDNTQCAHWICNVRKGARLTA